MQEILRNMRVNLGRNTVSCINVGCCKDTDAKTKTTQNQIHPQLIHIANVANSLSAGAPVAHAGTKSDQKSTDQISQRTDDGYLRIDPQTFVHQRIPIDIGRVRSDGEEKGGHEAQLPLLAGFRQGFAGSEEEGRGDARRSEDVAAEEEEGRGRQADETAAK